MKKTICYLVINCIIGCFTIQAQQFGRVYLNPKSFTQNGDRIEVEILFDMQYLRISSVESITYTPIIVARDAEYELPKLIIQGSRRYKADRREEVLNNRPVLTMLSQGGSRNYPIYSIEKFDRNKLVPYKVSVAYREWMSGATVSMREEISGCCNERGMVTQKTNIFENFTVGSQNIQPRFSYPAPERELEKNRLEIGKAFLDFAQGSSAINASFRNNQQELDKIHQMITKLMADPDIKINNIEMRGYASPESSASYNLELSSQRARALRDYFVRRNLIAPNLILIGIGGEDWEGLQSMLANYPVSYKDEILRIIHTVQDLDLREQRIRNLGNGEPYRQILRDLYPLLRRVDCRINYTARNFTIDEGKARIQAKPNLLSQDEMYQIAHTYPKGSQEFNRTLITAGQQFPDNDIANLNGAAAALSEGNATLAETYLKHVRNTSSPVYANCMGVFYLFQRNYNMSEEYLQKAVAGGINEASHNLRELQKIRNQ